MKTIYVKDLTAGLILSNETFAVAEVRAATDKNDRPYYDLILTDKTGDSRAKIWSDNIGSIDKSAMIPGRIVSISGKVEQFRNQLQVNVMELRGTDETKVEEYLESSMFDAAEMMTELTGVIDSLSNKHLQKLLQNIFDDSDIKSKFKYWRAANSFHHDFRSGLLQHVLEMLAGAAGLERFYPQADFDLIKTGIIVHDIGKLREIDSTGITSKYTTEGNLLGHVTLGLGMVREHMPDDIPAKLKLHLEHIILAHQGELEYASPVVPATLEAMIVYRLDGLSSDARKMDKGLREDGDEYGISQYNKWLNRWLWVGSRGE